MRKLRLRHCGELSLREIVGGPGRTSFSGRDCMKRNSYVQLLVLKLLFKQNFSFKFKIFFLLLQSIFPLLNTSSTLFPEAKQNILLSENVMLFIILMTIDGFLGSQTERWFDLSLKWYLRFPKGRYYGVSLQPDEWECILE